ncbi:hypothetical protein RvY_03925 [Ramazzottius varieornatus]|uniref:Uncharacterized protein n=1 Tax=Ramazzottius varieornatus TaxID=947166 RepID=A0A1D1UT83_RAMVA|nr:hypothetical protein RvY_03925 [Ramazzottius varieornatus]
MVTSNLSAAECQDSLSEEEGLEGPLSAGRMDDALLNMGWHNLVSPALGSPGYFLVLLLLSLRTWD